MNNATKLLRAYSLLLIFVIPLLTIGSISAYYRNDAGFNVGVGDRGTGVNTRYYNDGYYNRYNDNRYYDRNINANVAVPLPYYSEGYNRSGYYNDPYYNDGYSNDGFGVGVGGVGLGFDL